MKSAMKAGEAVKRDTLRMLDSMIKNTEIDLKKREEGLSDAEVQDVIARGIKQRRDAGAQAGRTMKIDPRGKRSVGEEEEQKITATAPPRFSHLQCLSCRSASSALGSVIAE